MAIKNTFLIYVFFYIKTNPRFILIITLNVNSTLILSCIKCNYFTYLSRARNVIINYTSVNYNFTKTVFTYSFSIYIFLPPYCIYLNGPARIQKRQWFCLFVLLFDTLFTDFVTKIMFRMPLLSHRCLWVRIETCDSNLVLSADFCMSYLHIGRLLPNIKKARSPGNEVELIKVCNE